MYIKKNKTNNTGYNQSEVTVKYVYSQSQSFQHHVLILLNEG